MSLAGISVRSPSEIHLPGAVALSMWHSIRELVTDMENISLTCKANKTPTELQNPYLPFWEPKGYLTTLFFLFSL